MTTNTHRVIRSTETGQAIARIGGHRGAAVYPDWITSQGEFGQSPAGTGS